jgi:NDP-sugar pyrophosphorylase family protein
MRAMILAAGLGTRLRPITNERPKALVEINGRTLLDIVLERLRGFGIREVVINVHHLPEMIASYLEKNQNFGMEIVLSREDVLLDTGGGLKKAAHFFLEQGNDEPFLVHNVDVLSTIDFGPMLQFHHERNALATLAVQRRQSSRQLLFDGNLQMCGRIAGDGANEIACSTTARQPLAFCGIHIMSPRIVPLITEEGVFSIVDSYLRLSKKGEKIVGFQADEYYWRDVGTRASLERAAGEMRGS